MGKGRHCHRWKRTAAMGRLSRSLGVEGARWSRPTREWLHRVGKLSFIVRPLISGGVPHPRTLHCQPGARVKAVVDYAPSPWEVAGFGLATWGAAVVTNSKAVS